MEDIYRLILIRRLLLFQRYLLQNAKLSAMSQTHPHTRPCCTHLCPQLCRLSEIRNHLGRRLVNLMMPIRADIKDTYSSRAGLGEFDFFAKNIADIAERACFG